MRRSLLKLAVVVSLASCVGTSVLWLRSYLWMDSVTLYPRQTGLLMQSLRGVISLQVIRPLVPASKLDPFRQTRADTVPASGAPSWRRFGVRPHAFDLPYPVGANRVQRFRGVEVRHGAVVLVAATFALVGSVAMRARRRGSVSVCSSCGYDLRATPGRCPECGADVRRTAA